MKFILLALSILCGYSSFAQKSLPSLPSKIAFGSCGSQDQPQPVLDLVVSHKPDLFIYLGDNIYGDTDDMKVLKEKYDLLASKPEYKNLKQNVPILGTWDDHDYGRNDAGKHYPHKEKAKELFLEFFDEPQNSPRRQHAGIYTSYMFEQKGKRLQLILLDNRTFRNDLRLYNGELKNDERYFYTPDYFYHENADSALLGEEQWAWLKTELLKPADLRLIGSGSQFSIEFNGYEAWANFPHEQKRFLELIKETKANGVVFLTGDVHYAEVSKLKHEGHYPIYDVTASGITSTWLFATPNKNRIEGPIMENHFGLLTIDWKKKIPTIKMEIWDVHNNQRIEHTISLGEIRF